MEPFGAIEQASFAERRELLALEGAALSWHAGSLQATLIAIFAWGADRKHLRARAFGEVAIQALGAGAVGLATATFRLERHAEAPVRLEVAPEARGAAVIAGAWLSVPGEGAADSRVATQVIGADRRAHEAERAWLSVCWRRCAAAAVSVAREARSAEDVVHARLSLPRAEGAHGCGRIAQVAW